jgi:hypothetical protein
MDAPTGIRLGRTGLPELIDAFLQGRLTEPQVEQFACSDPAILKRVMLATSARIAEQNGRITELGSRVAALLEQNVKLALQNAQRLEQNATLCNQVSKLSELVAPLQARVGPLQQVVRELHRRLNTNPSNASLRPSCCRVRS